MGGQEDAYLGTWAYRGGSSRYTISKLTQGGLNFEQGLPSGKRLSVELQLRGKWFQGTLRYINEPRELGSIRLRYVAASGGILSNSKKSGAGAWGEDIVAHRTQEQLED